MIDARHARLCAILIGFLVALPNIALAQLSLPGAGTALRITVSPSQPQPGDTVRLTIESPVINIADSDVTWYIDEKLVAQGIGVAETAFTAGAIGVRTKIRAFALAPDGTNATASVAIIPTQIDLLYDADSYVPPFYRGRPLPSAGTTLRLQAIAHFSRADGSAVPESTITYSWKRNGSPIPGASGRGRSSVTAAAPFLFSTDLITVEARSDEGITGGKTVSIASANPRLVLYPDQPLFGIRYDQAFDVRASLAGSEMTFAAVPYFVSAFRTDDPALRYEWSVNGTPVIASEEAPGEITINANGSQRTAEIALDLSHASNVFLGTKGAWNITFSDEITAADIFGARGI